MNNATLAAAVLTALAVVAAVSHPAPAHAAGTVIQRCQGNDGVEIYTDQACAALGATPLPMPGGLLRRLDDHGGWRRGADAGPSAAIAPRRPAASGCARTPTQLAMDLEGAFALGDVNRIAESYHWVGLSSTQGRHVMQRLERLSDEPLLQARHFDATIGGGWVQVAAAGAGIGVDAGGSAGIMQLVFGEDGDVARALDFDVRRYHGCYFVRF